MEIIENLSFLSEKNVVWTVRNVLKQCNGTIYFSQDIEATPCQCSTEIWGGSLT